MAAKKKSGKKKSSKTKSKTKSKKSKSKKSSRPTKVKNKNKSSKPTEVRYHSTKEIKVEKALIDNFVGLQKVMVNLSSKFDKLSDEISKLLNIFEISAKAMAKKEFQSEKDPSIKKIHDKLDNLSKQAGLIGKGLALIHEANTEEENEPFQNRHINRFEPQPSSIPRPRTAQHPMRQMPGETMKKSQSMNNPSLRPNPAPNSPSNQNFQSPPSSQNSMGSQKPEGSQTQELNDNPNEKGNMQPSIMSSKQEMTQGEVNQNQQQKPSGN